LFRSQDRGGPSINEEPVMSSRKIAVATLLSAGLMLAGNASAEVSGSVAVVSDYLFRGVTQTSENPALQGGVTWNHESGFYAGAWGSSISWLSDSDPEISSQVELDGFIEADTVELYFGLSWNVLSAKYSYATTDLFGIPDSDGSAALDLGAGWEFDGGWSVGAGYGRQWVSGYGGELDYDYWKLTAGKSFENGFGIGLEWHDTDLAGVDDTVLVSLSKSF